MPTLVLAGGHSSLGGTGTGITVDNEVMEGKTGVLVLENGKLTMG